MKRMFSLVDRLHKEQVSDETAKLIDKEIRKLIDIAENHAKKVFEKEYQTPS